MFDIGWTELLLIGVIALIVIGPKDLPVMFHTLGRMMARARGMAREFSSAMEDAAKASGVNEATKELRDLKALTSPRGMGLDALSRAADKFEKWDPLQPVRDAPAPDPAAPPPAPGQAEVRPPPGPATATAGTDSALPGPAADSPAPGVGAQATPSAPIPSPVEAHHQPGTRRLHAVRRTDRS